MKQSVNVKRLSEALSHLEDYTVIGNTGTGLATIQTTSNMITGVVFGIVAKQGLAIVSAHGLNGKVELLVEVAE